ncbi:MAG: hypothetical protein ACLUD2_11270 [Clostridium sp.]
MDPGGVGDGNSMQSIIVHEAPHHQATELLQELSDALGSRPLHYRLPGTGENMRKLTWITLCRGAGAAK